MATLELQGRGPFEGNISGNRGDQGFFNTIFPVAPLQRVAIFKKEFKENQDLIKLQKKLDAQYTEMEGYYKEIGLSSIRGHLTQLYENCLETEIDLVKAELTQDRSLFATLKKGPLTVYIDNYLDQEGDELNAIIFDGGTKLPSIEGPSYLVMNKLRQIIENK